MEIIVQIIGAIATAGSVFFAIFVFKRSEERRLFSKTRECLSQLKSTIEEVYSHLDQPNFSFISDLIVNELNELKPENWTLDEFTAFLVDEKSHDLIAQKVHVGRLKCPFIKTVERQLREIEQSVVLLKEKLPIISETIDKLSFYIESPANNSLAPKTFDLALGKPESINRMLIPNLSGLQHESHYFTEIKNYCAAFPQMVMEQDRLGQKTFVLSERIIQILIKTYSLMTDAQLRAASLKQKSLESKTRSIKNEHAAEDAISFLKLLKSDFSENDWDTIIESKGNIVQLMNSK